MKNLTNSIQEGIGSLSWLVKQLFSPHPDTSIDSGTKLMFWIAKGLLVIGALSSMSYTIPTFYSVFSGILVEWLAQSLTIFCVALVLFLIDLSLGAITPFVLSYTISGGLFDDTTKAIGGIGLWAYMLFLGSCSVYFTWSGADVPVEATIIAPESFDMESLQAKKKAAIDDEEKRHNELVAKFLKEDSTHLSDLKKSKHTAIEDARSYAIRQYGPHSKVVSDAVDRLRKDSIRKVEDFVLVQSKAPYYVRERTESLNRVRSDWDKIINQKTEEHNARMKKYNNKVSTAKTFIKVFGAGATVLFFLLVLIVTMISDDPGAIKKKGHP